MKNMEDRKMDMKAGRPDSSWYFPEEPHSKVLERVGEIAGFKYPDTEEAVTRDSEQGVRDATRNSPKPGFRH